MNHFKKKVTSSSTPVKYLKVSGRNSIHEDPEPSPIVKDAPKTTINSDVRIPESIKFPKRLQQNSKFVHPEFGILFTIRNWVIDNWVSILYCSIIIIKICVIVFFWPASYEENPFNLKILKSKFGNKNPELLHYFTSSIREINRFNRPSVIIFLYLEDHETESLELVKKIAKSASEYLSNDSKAETIFLRDSELNTNQYINDYGFLLEYLKKELETRHVMIVKDLENVKTNVAQAFHFVCDEYSPLVEQTLVIFMVKVKEFVGKEVTQVGNILRKSWMDLDEEKLEPLLARVISVVLRINF